MSSLKSTVESPCVHVCVLDEKDVCVGCDRTSDEILRWSKMSEDEQRQIVERPRSSSEE
jgi:predicted Fe-S protein YdhL (DUF1289 family)